MRLAAGSGPPASRVQATWIYLLGEKAQLTEENVHTRWLPIFAVALALPAGSDGALAADGNSFIGEVRFFASDFCPRGWILPNGRTLPIADYAALVTLLHERFGPITDTTFVLPRVRDQVVSKTGGKEVPLLSCMSVFGDYPARDD